MKYDPRIKLQVFSEPSTNHNDFCQFIPDKRQIHTWPKDRIEKPSKKSREFKREDPETFQKWREGIYIPFNIMIQPRPIIDTHPDTQIPKLEAPINKGKNEAMKSRPRIYMSPAVSMDDIPDLNMRNLLCQHMYTSDWQKAAKEAASNITDRPNCDNFKIAGDPVALHTNLYPPLAKGWREKAKSWDITQRRTYVDPTKSFWLNIDPPVKCGACKNPFKGVVQQELKDEIAGLIQKDKLRLAHDKPAPGYAGYKPQLSKGVPLSKVELPVTHPFLSASQAITQRYADNQKLYNGI